MATTIIITVTVDCDDCSTIGAVAVAGPGETVADVTSEADSEAKYGQGFTITKSGAWCSRCAPAALEAGRIVF
jgi:hypothetical protein